MTELQTSAVLTVLGASTWLIIHQNLWFRKSVCSAARSSFSSCRSLASVSRFTSRPRCSYWKWNRVRSGFLFLFNLSYLNELQTLDSNPPAEALTQRPDVWRLAAPTRLRNFVGTNKLQIQHLINMLKSRVPTFYQPDSESRPLTNHFLGLNCFPKAALR